MNDIFYLTMNLFATTLDFPSCIYQVLLYSQSCSLNVIQAVFFML